MEKLLSEIENALKVESKGTHQLDSTLATISKHLIKTKFPNLMTEQKVELFNEVVDKYSYEELQSRLK